MNYFQNTKKVKTKNKNPKTEHHVPTSQLKEVCLPVELKPLCMPLRLHSQLPSPGGNHGPLFGVYYFRFMTYYFACFKILYWLHHMTPALANISLNIKLIRFTWIYVAQIHLCFLLWSLPLYRYTQIYWPLWRTLRVFHHSRWKPFHSPFISQCPRGVSQADSSTQHSASQLSGLTSLSPLHLLLPPLPLRLAFGAPESFLLITCHCLALPPLVPDMSPNLTFIVTNQPRSQLNKAPSSSLVPPILCKTMKKNV